MCVLYESYCYCLLYILILGARWSSATIIGGILYAGGVVASGNPIASGGLTLNVERLGEAMQCKLVSRPVLHEKKHELIHHHLISVQGTGYCGGRGEYRPRSSSGKSRRDKQGVFLRACRRVCQWNPVMARHQSACGGEGRQTSDRCENR